MEHPKRIGDMSTLAIMDALFRLGFEIYMPFGENARSDLIMDDETSLIRVRCKTGRLRRGAVVFAVCSSYGHHRNPTQARRNYTGQVDCFAVYCPETSGIYLVPVDDAPPSSVAALRVDPPRNNQRKTVRLGAEYEVARVAIEGLRVPSGA